MSRPSLTIEQTLSLLAAAPTRLAALTKGLTPAQLRARPRPDEWSANDILAHLRACADVRGGALLTILAEDRPTLRAVNPRSYIKQTNYLDLEFRPSLRAFTRQRARLMAALQPLSRQDWSRSANITGAGKPLVWTARFYAEWLAIHERPHLKQIEQLMQTLPAAPR